MATQSPIPNLDDWMRRQPQNPAINVTAQQSPELTALTGRWEEYRKNLENNTGHAMDVAGQKFRDVREGGAKSLAASEGARGIASGTSQERYAGDTARGEQAAITDAGLEHERMQAGALQGEGEAAKAPLEMALAEKRYGLDAAQLQNQQNNQQFNQFLALLQAQRQSPIYTGGDAGGGGGGHAGGGAPIYTGSRIQRGPVFG